MKDRFLEVSKSLGYQNLKEFAEALGRNNSYLSQVFKRGLNEKFIHNIRVTFPRVNIDYLETGVGEPLKPESPASEPVDGLESAKAFLLDLFRSLPPDKQSTLAELAKAIVEERPAPSPGEKKA